MKQKFYNIPVKEQDELDYLNESVKRFVNDVFKKEYKDSLPVYNKNKNLHYKVIKELYLLGRFLRRIPWNFNVFTNLIYQGFRSPVMDVGYPQILVYSYENNKKKSKYSWVNKRYYRHITKSAFQRQDHHVKKELSQKDLAKKEWRDSKKFNKDRLKNSNKYGPASKRSYKKNDAKRRRSWEHKKMRAGKYDEIFFHKDQFVSSWDIY